MESGKIQYTFIDPNPARDVEQVLYKLAVKQLLSREGTEEIEGRAQGEALSWDTPLPEGINPSADERRRDA